MAYFTQFNNHTQSHLNQKRTHNVHLKLRQLWPWNMARWYSGMYKQIKLNKSYHHAKFDTCHIHSVWENHNANGPTDHNTDSALFTWVKKPAARKHVRVHGSSTTLHPPMQTAVKKHQKISLSRLPWTSRQCGFQRHGLWCERFHTCRKWSKKGYSCDDEEHMQIPNCSHKSTHSRNLWH